MIDEPCCGLAAALQRNSSHTSLRGWNCTHGHPRASVCSWTGMSCAGGLVTSISLPGRYLHGSIPSSIGLFSSLMYLNLDHNSLTGTIPSTISKLSHLTSLQLSYNKFRGSIPSNISLLVNLVDLNLDANSLTGTIPVTLRSMSSLTSLSLSSNKFTGSVPSSLCNMSLGSLSFANQTLFCYPFCLSTVSNLVVRTVPQCSARMYGEC